VLIRVAKSIIHWQYIKLLQEYDFTKKLIEDEFYIEAFHLPALKILMIIF